MRREIATATEPIQGNNIVQRDANGVANYRGSMDDLYLVEPHPYADPYGDQVEIIRVDLGNIYQFRMEGTVSPGSHLFVCADGQLAPYSDNEGPQHTFIAGSEGHDGWVTAQYIGIIPASEPRNPRRLVQPPNKAELLTKSLNNDHEDWPKIAGTEFVF